MLLGVRNKEGERPAWQLIGNKYVYVGMMKEDRIIQSSESESETSKADLNREYVAKRESSLYR